MVYGFIEFADVSSSCSASALVDWGSTPSCDLKDFVCAIACDHCQKIYTGETKQPAAKRFAQHLGGIFNMKKLG